MSQATLVTIEQKLEHSPQSGRWELFDGEVRTMAPASFNHGRIAGEVYGRLWEFVRSNRLGVVTAAETGFILARDPDRLLAADVAFVRKERIGSEHATGFFDGPPDLAVEVVSPNDKQTEVEAKTCAWFDGGTREVWVVWPWPA